MEPQRVVFLLVFFTLFVIHVQAKNETKPVYFSLIVSRGEHGYNSSGVIPVIKIALDQIARQQILRNYSLTYATEQNSKVGRLLHFEMFHLFPRFQQVMHR